eukprot:scaffold162_cov79-Isochrysis_galbana.AAC.2
MKGCAGCPPGRAPCPTTTYAASGWAGNPRKGGFAGNPRQETFGGRRTARADGGEERECIRAGGRRYRPSGAAQTPCTEHRCARLPGLVASPAAAVAAALWCHAVPVSTGGSVSPPVETVVVDNGRCSQSGKTESRPKYPEFFRMGYCRLARGESSTPDSAKSHGRVRASAAGGSLSRRPVP